MADTHDADELKRFGYAQQLKRSMEAHLSFALLFSVIFVLTGGVTPYGHGLKYGGPLEMTLFVAAGVGDDVLRSPAPG